MKTAKFYGTLFPFLAAALLPAGPAPAADPGTDEIARSTLKFMAQVQVKKPDGVYVPGEWKAEVYANAVSEVLGIGEQSGNEEPSAFTTGSIMNQLAMIHEDHPEYTEIPKIVGKAAPSLDRFREGGLYNFYPPKEVNGTRVHQAASMRLTSLWIGFTNVPEDADTTSVAHTARFLNARMNGKTARVPDSVFRSLSAFRDVNRDPHWYNEKQRMLNTGAFLTWQADENDPRNAQRQFARPEEGKRLPFETNDVDCVVNLNALRMLALSGRSNTRGARESCALMNYVIESQGYAKCGMYYPNTYNFAYSASLVDKAGQSCMRGYTPKMVEFILSHQSPDGSWENVDNYDNEDRVQASAFAMHALAQFGNPGDKRVRRALESGSRFLKSRMRRTRSGATYWPGEVFFTATAIARSVINWKSDAYTTSLALGALLDADKVLHPRAPAPAAATPAEEKDFPLPPVRPAL